MSIMVIRHLPAGEVTFPYQFLVTGSYPAKPDYTIDENDGTQQPVFQDMDLSENAGPSPDRIIIASCYYEEAGLGTGPFDFTGCEVNGVTAVEAATSAASGATNLALYVAEVPDDNTGDCEFTVSGTLPAFTDFSMMLYGRAGYDPTPHDTAGTLGAGTDISVSIDVPAGGIVVAVAVQQDAAYGGTTWTNADEVYDVVDGDQDYGISLAAKFYASTQTGLSVTAAKTAGGGAVSFYIVAASFAPL